MLSEHQLCFLTFKQKLLKFCFVFLNIVYSLPKILVQVACLFFTNLLQHKNEIFCIQENISYPVILYTLPRRINFLLRDKKFISKAFLRFPISVCQLETRYKVKT